MTKEIYNDFFKKYGPGVHDDPIRFSEIAKLCRGFVLDLGCGSGTLADFYSGPYKGVDISDVAIGYAIETKRKSALFACADVFRFLESEVGQYDTIVMAEFLEHILPPFDFLEKVLRLLRPGGRLVVSVPNFDRVPDKNHLRTFSVPQLRKTFSPIGHVRFYNWPGAQKRILMTCDIGQKNVHDVALVMIAKDEAKGIERALLSALPFCDKIVVSVDSKTIDRTAEIAGLYADEVKTHVWADDFSAARNAAQEGIKEKWILCLDGHEYIETAGDILEKLKCDVEGVFVTIKMESGMTFLFPRFYRSGLVFKNKVHNLLEVKTKRASPEFVVVHDRLSGQDSEAIERRNKQREEMMPKQLLKDIKANPKNARPYFHLANFCMMRHDRKAAIKYYKKAIKYGKSIDEKYLCLLHLGALQASFGRYFRALWAMDKADKLLPGRWESARTIGGLYFMTQRFEKALPWLTQALIPNSRRYCYQPMEQNFGDLWDMIAHCYIKLNQPAEAVIAWNRAIETARTDATKKLYTEKKKFATLLLPNTKNANADN